MQEREIEKGVVCQNKQYSNLGRRVRERENERMKEQTKSEIMKRGGKERGDEKKKDG